MRFNVMTLLSPTDNLKKSIKVQFGAAQQLRVSLGTQTSSVTSLNFGGGKVAADDWLIVFGGKQG